MLIDEKRIKKRKKGRPKLTKKEAKIIEKLHNRGLNEREISRILGIPKTTVHDSLQRTQKSSKQATLMQVVI